MDSVWILLKQIVQLSFMVGREHGLSLADFKKPMDGGIFRVNDNHVVNHGDCAIF